MNAARVADWVWRGTVAGRVARLPLIPFSLLYGATMRLRAAAYRQGWLATERLPLPTIAIGNLSVGGTGKTPLAAWIAAYCGARGRKAGILLRGYGADEPLVHQRLVPDAVVVADPDRAAGARRAAAGGAQVLVLDDAFQLLRVARDLNIAVISVESSGVSSWALPAGPWREGRQALGRADWVVLTRKFAGVDVAGAMAEEMAARRPARPVSVAHLALDGFTGMRSDTRVPGERGPRTPSDGSGRDRGSPQFRRATQRARRHRVSCWPIRTITRTLSRISNGWRGCPARPIIL